MEGRNVMSLMYAPGKLVLSELQPQIIIDPIENKKNNRRSIIGLDRKTYLEQKEKKNNDQDDDDDDDNNNNNNIIILEINNKDEDKKKNENHEDPHEVNKREGIDLRQTLNFGGNNLNNNSHIISQIMGSNNNNNNNLPDAESIIGSNVDLEESLRKEQIGIQKLLSKCILPSYMVSPIMNLQLSFIMMILSIKWGFSEYSLVPITFYSLGQSSPLIIFYFKFNLNIYLLNIMLILILILILILLYSSR
jgi:hypothetical protein